MSRTLTIFIDFKKLYSCGKTAPLVIRLMMACNDIFCANRSLSKVEEIKPLIRKHVKKGEWNYFIRLQCGHLNEAIKIIKEIKDDKELFSIVEKCTKRAKNAFDKLVNCLKGGPSHNEFGKYVGTIRHNTVFHYDERNKLINKVLFDRSQRSEMSTITLGDDSSLARFELADDILESIVVRELWGISRNLNIEQEVSRISDFASGLCKDFCYFSGQFIIQYIKEKQLAK